MERHTGFWAQVLGIAGNHDQGERIEIPPRLLREGAGRPTQRNSSSGEYEREQKLDEVADSGL